MDASEVGAETVTEWGSEPMSGAVMVVSRTTFDQPLNLRSGDRLELTMGEDGVVLRARVRRRRRRRDTKGER